MVVNLALAVMTRAAPQLNLIAIGFPFMILFGILVLLLTANSVAPLFERFFERALDLGRTLVSQA
jgi:flagellar biosynthetic protein FliR